MEIRNNRNGTIKFVINRVERLKTNFFVEEVEIKLNKEFQKCETHVTYLERCVSRYHLNVQCDGTPLSNVTRIMHT